MVDHTDNMPWSDQYRIAGEEWVDLDAAATLLEDLKSVVMAQRQSQLGGDIPVNRAEQTVKASPEWEDYVRKTVAARQEANKAKVKLEYLRMRFWEFQSAQANQRTEMKL